MRNSFLSSYATSKPKILNLADGEEVQVKYVSAGSVPSNYGGGNCVQYIFELNGINRRLVSASADLAQNMAEITEGSVILLSRSGTGYTTTYHVKLVEDAPKEDSTTESW